MEEENIDEGIGMEEAEEQEYLETGRVYKISNNVSKQKLKEEFEKLYHCYLELSSEFEEYKDDLFKIAKNILRNKKYETEDLKVFNKKIISEFLKELKEKTNEK